MRRIIAATLAIALAPPLAAADEGMWTFDAFPKEKLHRAHGFAPTDAWLEHARLSSVRLAGGCSGSFVSPNGLVMTNHHCAQECIQGLSTAEKDLFANGFTAPTQADELRCPDVEVNQLVAIADVTARIRKATAGLSGEAFQKALDAETARIESACQTSADLLCQVVRLYRGGVYDLYTYRRYQDVRLVFAPEFRIAFFGGDPDNFEFPRYDLDVSFLRVYQDGKPAATKDHFGWSPGGPKEGELVFVSGNPGETKRLLTVAQLADERDAALPETLIRFAETRGLLLGYQLLGAEAKRTSMELLFTYENAFKARTGEWDALRQPAFFESLVRRERDLRAKLARAKDGKRYLAAYDAIAKAQVRKRALRVQRLYVDTASRHESRPAAFPGELFFRARTIVRGAAERAKPNDQRLPEFSEASLPALVQTLLSPAPIYPDVERVRLAHGLGKLREMLGPDHPVVRKVLGKESPAEIAARAVSGTKLFDPAFRKSLWEGGAAAVDASDDPMIALARLVDPDARAIRRQWESEVEAVEKKNAEILAEGRFAVEGRSTYPDATFTPRLSYGVVKGWKQGDRSIPPFTRLAGAYERATGKDPFQLPESWIRAKDRLDLETPMNFVTTNDIVGGNSGSPVFDREGRIVGLVFDGNRLSLGGDFGFDETVNRTVAVDSAALIEALSKVYGASRIVEELAPAQPARAR
jgi:hypothetical protein